MRASATATAGSSQPAARANRNKAAANIIAIANQKGGVGKTTTAINLCAEMARRGRRVLLVDIDPQGNATTGLGIEKASLPACMYDVILKSLPMEEVLQATRVEGLQVAPATLNLAGAEIELVSAMSRELRLRTALEPLRDRYDYMCVDCPPSLGLLTLNALSASASLIVPIQAEYFALEGLGQLTRVIELVQQHLNSALHILGVLITMFDGRTNLAVQVVQEVEKFFPGLMFATRVPRSVRLSEAPSFGAPIAQFDPRGKGAVAYAALAEEVLARE